MRLSSARLLRSSLIVPPLRYFLANPSASNLPTPLLSPSSLRITSRYAIPFPCLPRDPRHSLAHPRVPLPRHSNRGPRSPPRTRCTPPRRFPAFPQLSTAY